MGSVVPATRSCVRGLGDCVIGASVSVALVFVSFSLVFDSDDAVFPLPPFFFFEALEELGGPPFPPPFPPFLLLPPFARFPFFPHFRAARFPAKESRILIWAARILVSDTPPFLFLATTVALTIKNSSRLTVTVVFSCTMEAD